MPVRKDKRSQFYTYEFELDGRRFYGPTKRTNEREALAIEKQEREKARQKLAAEAKLRNGPLTLRLATGRYWQEVGQFHAGANTTWRNLERLIEFFGPDEPMAAITGERVAALVSWRRGHSIPNRRRKPCKTPFAAKRIANATVNRSTLEPLKKIFNRAQKAWGYEFKDAEGKSTVPDWKLYRLEEPEERVRELKPDELQAHLADLRADYAPFFAFAREVAPRLKECLIRWPQVNWETGKIEIRGKGSRTVYITITKRIAAILRSQEGNHPEWVFTYVAQRSRPRMGLRKGARYPITYNGVKAYWKRHRKRAGLTGGGGIEAFRFHDFRHDLGTKLLRKTGNLKLVQKALNHRNIKTTTKYAHVLDEDLRAGLERVSDERANVQIVEDRKETA